jgi:hypothetical protein
MVKNPTSGQPRAYTPPKAMRLGDTIQGCGKKGACETAGSSADLYCTEHGSGAHLYCEEHGSGASLMCSSKGSGVK